MTVEEHMLGEIFNHVDEIFIHEKDPDEIQNFILTCRTYECQESIINELVSEQGDDVIPCRCVDIVEPMPIFRSTIISLTKIEAEKLKKDPRVISLIEKDIDDRLKPHPMGKYSGNFRKNYFGTWNQNDGSWALLRSTSSLSSRELNWGKLDPGFSSFSSSIAVTDSTNQGDESVAGILDTPAEGRDVDIVIIDTGFDDGSPEFLTNPDGTGTSRFVRYNWFQHNPEVTGSAPSVYVYSDSSRTFGNSSRENGYDHGLSCASVAAGSTCGIAKKANIYSIDIFNYGTSGSFISSDLLAFGYIRAFHRNKPINPKTGRKNPTIVSGSYGYSLTFNAFSVTFLTNEGVGFNGPFTIEQLRNFGVSCNNQGIVTINPSVVNAGGSRKSALEDMMNDGIIISFSAGNSDIPHYKAGHPKFNDIITLNTGTTYFRSRGSIITETDDAIVVGALSMDISGRKSRYSSKGNRVNVFAPGEGNKAQAKNVGGVTNPRPGSVNDSRDTDYQFVSFGGTSNACPVVVANIACALEVYPWMTQKDVLRYIEAHSSKNIIETEIENYTGVNSPVSNWEFTTYGLWEAPNLTSFYKKERDDDGVLYPKKDYFIRPEVGNVYPRRKIRIRG